MRHFIMVNPAQRPRHPIEVELAQQGDLRAFIKLVGPIHDRLYAYAFLMCGSAEEADRCVHQGVLLSQRTIKDIGELSPLAFFVHQTRRVVMSYLRQQPIHPHQVHPDTGRVLKEAVQNEDAETILVALQPLLASLSIEERDAYVLAVVLGLGRGVVESITRTPENVIENRLARACERLSQGSGVEVTPPTPTDFKDDEAKS